MRNAFFPQPASLGHPGCCANLCVALDLWALALLTALALSNLVLSSSAQERRGQNGGASARIANSEIYDIVIETSQEWADKIARISVQIQGLAATVSA